MRYDLVALDMDGTLLNSDHVTTPYTREVLRRVAEAGGSSVLCTGRCLSELEKHLAVLPHLHYAVCENGACIYDVREKRAIRQISLPMAEVRFLLETARRFDVLEQCFVENQSYLQPFTSERLEHFNISTFAGVFREGSRFVEDLEDCCLSHASVEKINFFFPDRAECARFVECLEGHDICLFGSVGIGVEASPRHATKAVGLEMLCAHLGIPMDRVIAVGDGGNDLEVMRAAGLAVAMGNAIDEVIGLADVVTEDCDHDGAARAIERYMFA